MISPLPPNQVMTAYVKAVSDLSTVSGCYQWQAFADIIGATNQLTRLLTTD
ncbi:MAG: hypothetical protein R2828_04540 [Saprospiraceae bacterium]